MKCSNSLYYPFKTTLRLRISTIKKNVIFNLPLSYKFQRCGGESSCLDDTITEQAETSSNRWGAGERGPAARLENACGRDPKRSETNSEKEVEGEAEMRSLLRAHSRLVALRVSFKAATRDAVLSLLSNSGRRRGGAAHRRPASRGTEAIAPGLEPDSEGFSTLRSFYSTTTKYSPRR